jgi:hypothetical protein
VPLPPTEDAVGQTAGAEVAARFGARWSRQIADAETAETPADATGRCCATFGALRSPHPYHG